MELSHAETPSVQGLLQSGDPFVPFSEFSIETSRDLLGGDASDWVQSRLKEGKPFVIRGFSRLESWNRSVFNNESLAALSSSEAIPIRNCESTRDVRMRLRDLLSPTGYRTNIKESLYAKDLHCPSEWTSALEAVLPSPLRHLGSLDLFRVLPKEIAPEVLMAYVGTRKSFSGFHRCFSATVALSLLIESEGHGPGTLCFGTDTSSRAQYDAFMEDLGKSSHTDWAKVSIEQLKLANFPIYITNQEPGDLVVFPSATSHQIWNISPMVTKVVWNIMHASSLESFFDYVQPAYQMQCHTDTGRVPLIPFHALNSGLEVPESRLLLDIFRRLVDDEDMGNNPNVSIKLVDTQGAVVECNFCGLTIWNRHLHCEQCGDFDLCLACFVSGRSCKHTADYAWAELVPSQRCQEIIKKYRETLQYYPPDSRIREFREKPLGILALAAADARKQPMARLCHLCRDNHPVWKGTPCSQCDAFFCFRGLYRHFDVDLLSFLRQDKAWTCPKCLHECNCRCCRYPHRYQSKDKPVRTRVKPVDPRGRIYGFVDNVFDQRRGKKASLPMHSASSQGSMTPRGQKRPRESGENEHVKPNPHNGHVYLPSIRPEAFDITPPRGTPSYHPGHNGSLGSLGPKMQLRISDLVEDRNSPIEATSTPRSGIVHHPPPNGPSRDGSGSRNDHRPSEFRSVENGESIAALERKRDSLRQYANDLIELDLVDSHAKVMDAICQLDGEIEKRRRAKAELLFSNLHRDFPDLAELAREEARRRGI
ncbi:hypothetical protein P170DRAFT_507563 [Aspergillus steynii IBT 23096]|uniref:JmjC domain-containing protein n=1 Tax=Aspergillus steynii IBT 23096 TaxID=1392250 RepID=A0A2I2GIW2_9EURO|nr:uncharacterized protein P170DRAFT_507563 [Aspergillus steynii IBT 23096]PLB52824.1 hypothetical protein P170DRAFT_507563 [Aspergillus steynii IBT 23096]